MIAMDKNRMRVAGGQSGIEAGALAVAQRSDGVKQDLVEIRCEKDFPGERLVVCMNPAFRPFKTETLHLRPVSLAKRIWSGRIASFSPCQR